MAKNTVWFVIIVVVGALLGSFIGKFLGMVIPDGSIKDLFATEISAGLAPATLDLRVLDLTVGCMLRFNITSVVGILAAAWLFNKIGK
jgi:hypothetical protein